MWLTTELTHAVHVDGTVTTAFRRARACTCSWIFCNAVAAACFQILASTASHCISGIRVSASHLQSWRIHWGARPATRVNSALACGAGQLDAKVYMEEYASCGPPLQPTCRRTSRRCPAGVWRFALLMQVSMQRKSCWLLVWHKDGAMLMANKELKSQTMLIIHRLCGVMPCASWHADEISRSKDVRSYGRSDWTASCTLVSICLRAAATNEISNDCCHKLKGGRSAACC
jgi:hypothetical protein